MAKPEVPRSEKNVSAALLIALGAIFLFVVLAGKQSPPDRESQPGIASIKLPYKLPAGAKLTEGWHSYPEQRIYEKIDGRAALFQEYGIDRLDFASVSFDKTAFDIYSYVMKDAKAALGVYLEEASQESRELDLADLADLAGATVRAVKGNTYLVVMPLARDADKKGTIELARSILSSLGGTGTASKTVIDLLPKNGRIKGTLVYNKESAFGLRSLGDTVSARYRVRGKEFDFFLRKVSRNKGDEFLQAVHEELKRFGAENLTFEDGRLAAMFLGRCISLVRVEGIVGGVYGDMTAEQARKCLEMLLSDLTGRTDAK